MTSDENQKEQELSKKVTELSKNVLQALEDGKDEVQIEELMSAVEEYTSLPNHSIESIKKWQGDIAEITKLLEAQYLKVQEELRGMVQNNPKLAAYSKAGSVEEEE